MNQLKILTGVRLTETRAPKSLLSALTRYFACAMLCCMEEALLKRITLNPDVCFGKPTIRNMRYPVEMILDLLGAGMSFADILADYPDLEREDLQACLLFAGKLVKVNSIHKVLAA